jgi:hypothetical protein
MQICGAWLSGFASAREVVRSQRNTENCMPLTCKNAAKGPDRANKLFVTTTCSQDGRNRDGFWIDCDPSVPDQSNALYLLTVVVDASSAVESYSIYDANGNRDTNFDSARFPKRA